MASLPPDAPRSFSSSCSRRGFPSEKLFRPLSPIVSRGGCYRAVIRQCDFIITDCEQAGYSILTESEHESALVIEQDRLCY